MWESSRYDDVWFVYRAGHRRVCAEGIRQKDVSSISSDSGTQSLGKSGTCVRSACIAVVDV